ncbi:ABC transporter substrate-binding protein [Streptomyces sp. NRRL F-5126]|uniref:ABC transporter substrate-binding protein n=1 Tax=Streptomyces sp. NRRL F-5126 TaxID=1463857 RepID=UPI0004C9DD1E|nr:ABC transporter substrate-binding protein [Streptomyces sp. NRRL F-5126]
MVGQRDNTGVRHSRRRRTRGAAAAATGLALLLAGGCSGGAESSTTASGTFTLGVPVPLPSADPYNANTGSGQMQYLSYLAYDPLVNQKSDGTFQTGLAKRWSTTDTSATFQLRDDVTCSDGSRLTAHQVASDLTYVGDPKNAYPWLGSLTPTVGYTVHGDDATGTVTIHTKSPYPFLLETLGNVPIVCATGMKDKSTLTHSSDGTGPFVLTSSDQTTYTYRVRKGYAWGPDGARTSAAGTPDKVVLKVVTNPTTAANELLAGQLTATQVLGQDGKRLTSAGIPRATVQTQTAALYFTETAEQATTDRGVRRALAAAMDFRQLVKVQSLSSGEPATRSTALRTGAPLPCPGADATTQLPAHDLAAAGKLLDAAGWKKGPHGTRVKGGKPLSLTIAYQHDNEESVAQLLQSEWRSLGAKVTLDLLTTQQKQAFINGSADFAVLIAASAQPLPTQIQQEVSGPGAPTGMNLQKVNNPEYDRLAAKAIAEPGTKGCPLWVKAENSVLRAADIVPIADQPSVLFTAKSAAARLITTRQPIPTSLKLH